MILVSKRGVIFVFACVMVGFVLALSGATLARSTIEHRASRLDVSRLQAFHLSESGLDVAIHQLQRDPNYEGADYTALGPSAGGYAMTVIHREPSSRIIRATGYHPSSNPAVADYATNTVEAVVQLIKRAGPGNGVVGVESVQLNGWGCVSTRRDRARHLKLDSYDSRQGPYTAEASRGSLRVCTNDHRERAMSLMGGVAINGDVVLGPGSDPDRTLWQVPEHTISISGAVVVSETAVPVEEVVMPQLPDRGRLSISGDEEVILEGGLYRFRNIRISGHGKLIFTGPAQVYVDHRVEIVGHGAIATPDQRSTNLTLYVQGGRVGLSGHADLYARVHAPNAIVEISGDGDLYGAVIGRDVVVNGRGTIHYDEALNFYDEALNSPKSGAPPFQAKILSWREVH